MRIDFDDGVNFFRKAYNKAKKNKIIPLDPIDIYENYIIDMASPMDKSNMLNSMATMTGRVKFEDHHAVEFLENMPMNNILVTTIYKDTVINYMFMHAHGQLYTERQGYDGSYEQNAFDNIVIFELYAIFKKISENKIYLYKDKVNYSRKRDGRLLTNAIVLVSLDRSSVKYPFVEINKVDWKHSWSVVGHWRKVKRIGKNKFGDYCEAGRTWVIPTIKGTGTFKSKPRVCIGE